MQPSEKTQQEMDRRRSALERNDIKRLFALYRARYQEGDLVGANQIAWLLSAKHGIEGEHSFALGASQE